jgi:hypothetical protein
VHIINEDKVAYTEVAIKLYKDIAMAPKDKRLKESIINAAVALKLAMNLYEIEKEERKDDGETFKNESELSV